MLNFNHQLKEEEKLSRKKNMELLHPLPSVLLENSLHMNFHVNFEKVI